MKTVAAEEADVSMAYILADDAEEEVDEAEKDTPKEVLEGAAAHMKMEFKSQMSPVTLNIQSGTQSQTIQGKI